MTLEVLVPSLRSSLYDRLEPGRWPASAVAGERGGLWVGGVDLSELAPRFGTPAYVLDESDVRRRCRDYRAALPAAEIAYAGKAFLCRAMARLVAEEGLSLDVRSAGELAVARAAGVAGERVVLHGNVKTTEDLKAAVAAGVGRVVVDSLPEIDQLADLAVRPQRVLLRVAPGIDAGTHAAVTTGTEDQKFGFSVASGAVLEAVARVLAHPSLKLVGLHCHLGSQIRGVAPFERAVDVLVGLLAEVSRRHGVLLGELDLGGGHAAGDGETFDLAGFARRVTTVIGLACARHSVPVPRLCVEPGRAIVARAGVTVCRVATVKHAGSGRWFVAVDGGMSDNPRPALYGARYPVGLIGRASSAEWRPATVAGRHCESGDILATDIALPADVGPGDLLAVPGTGAYHHSMASTYNLVGRPPVVAVADGTARLWVRRETEGDLMVRDLG